MKFLLEHLKTHVDMPASTRESRELLDDVGIEVKSVDATAVGTVFNCELLANRGDHYCYEGVAREVSGRTDAPLRYPKLRKLDVHAADATRVKIESPLCLVYTVTELFAPVIPSEARNLGGRGADDQPLSPLPHGSLAHARDDKAPLPPEVLAPLTAADVHSISAPVDASNLANFDIGQPTHAFDADKIDGPITIRLSRKGERAWMLFTPEAVEIPKGTLVIADDSKILGIAGVIGCVESGISDKTTRILLESACFDPVAVRIASRQLNQNTDAAARFMRGGDPTLPLIGAARVAYLLEQHAGYRVGNAYRAGEWKDPERKITVDVKKTGRFIGAELSAFAMAERLTRYGFTVELHDDNTLIVTVPPRRLWDVNFEADIAEELLKSVGYNNTPITLPTVQMGALPSHVENVGERVNEVLVAEGFYEIFTDSFYGRGVRERLGITEGDPLWPHVEMQNSIERNYSLMRNNTIAQALDALAANVNNKLANVKIFEWVRIYLPDLSERGVLWALANGRDRGPFWADKGRPADAIYLKGIVEQLRLELRVDLKIGATDGHRLERFFHPRRRGGVWLNDRIVGIFGELHPLLLQRFDIKRQRPVYLEIETDALFTTPLPRVYTDPPTRQPIVRSVAYAIPSGIPASAIRDALASAAPPFLREIRIVDVYEIPNDPRRARAVTFEIEYLSEEALTGETINAATEAMMAAVVLRFGDQGVSLRA
ncbi:MAG TPA: phenylalanine--tRNA ligase subunit beta [Thermoanaerobaculia bacterium]|nr:phenylalanine--tRNA ligase subunit beta [Thermoanaerobaculia bacterium]